MSERILNAQGILSSDVPTGNLIWVDQVNGVDGLATRGRMTIPFRTLGAAKTAAKSGDTIMVLPATYALPTTTSPNLLKTGVNWHFLPGAKITYAGSANGALFDTSSYGTNSAVTSMVTGFGEFEFTATTGSAHIVNSAAAGSSLLIQARSFSSKNTAVKIGDTSGSAKCVVEVLEDIIVETADAVQLNGASSQNFIRARLIKTTGGAALYVGSGAGSIDVAAYRLHSTVTSAVNIAGGAAGSQISIRAYEILADLESAVIYDATNPVLRIFGARIVATGFSSDGRSVHIQSNSTRKITLAGCTLIASGDFSIAYVSTPAIEVFAVGGIVGSQNTSNVTVKGNDFIYEPNIT